MISPPVVSAPAPVTLTGAIYFGDGRDLFDHPILRKHDLAINMKVGVLTCIRAECGLALTSNWDDHLRKKHKSKKDLKDDLAIISGLCNQHCKPNPKESLIKEPVQGVTLHAGFACDRCSEYIGPKNSVKTHFYQQHPGFSLQMTACNYISWYQKNIRVSLVLENEKKHAFTIRLINRN
jgi:hypothetical protein